MCNDQKIDSKPYEQQHGSRKSINIYDQNKSFNFQWGQMPHEKEHKDRCQEEIPLIYNER
ncbi:hypothetical protein DERP_006525 [Dermatophagoides pteronyssinus]|uniref:Uncharacterized protein n=1 Tax=Dermatophagoides pteronyssinus TaxID=6956 RepID=A0ABQ8IQG1_DERPT|nr:hypothetical protein DERP_006525 [Dermatophagoides pteronyssinus]